MVTASILRVREENYLAHEGGEILMLFQETKYNISKFQSDIHFFFYKQADCQLKMKIKRLLHEVKSSREGLDFFKNLGLKRYHPHKGQVFVYGQFPDMPYTPKTFHEHFSTD